MSAHWRLAFWYAAWIIALVVPTVAVISYVYGGAYAGAVLYGVGTGIASSVSVALTVSLLTQRTKLWQAMGVASFVARYGFVAVALGVPAYLRIWPVVAMLCGFAGVYLIENVVLLPRALRVVGSSSMRRSAERSVGEGVERRVEA